MLEFINKLLAELAGFESHAQKRSELLARAGICGVVCEQVRKINHDPKGFHTD